MDEQQLLASITGSVGQEASIIVSATLDKSLRTRKPFSSGAEVLLPRTAATSFCVRHAAVSLPSISKLWLWRPPSGGGSAR